MTTGTEALVLRAYHFAEGDFLDARGFIDLFAENGVFTGIGGPSAQRATGVSIWAMWSSRASSCPTFTGNCTGSTCSGRRRDRAVDRGTFLGPFETPAGVIQPTEPSSTPTADFWYVRDGKSQEFNCRIGAAMFAQLGVLPDFTSAVAVRPPR